MKLTQVLVPAVSLVLASGVALAMPLDRMDTDDDGTITREEFMNRHEEMFDKLDKDDDGEISREERKEAREKFKERYKKHKDKMKRDDDKRDGNDDN